MYHVKKWFGGSVYAFTLLQNSSEISHHKFTTVRTRCIAIPYTRIVWLFISDGLDKTSPTLNISTNSRMQWYDRAISACVEWTSQTLSTSPVKRVMTYVHGCHIQTSICVARDGTRLYTTIYDLSPRILKNRCPSRIDTVLIRTPYNRHLYFFVCQAICTKGYRVVCQDTRSSSESSENGCIYDSLFVQEGRDGAAYSIPGYHY